MSPRRSPGRTIGGHERLRVNVLSILDERERSIAWLARKMTDVGCPISAPVLWKALRDDRIIYVNEWIAMSEVLGVPMQDLVA